MKPRKEYEGAFVAISVLMQAAFSVMAVIVDDGPWTDYDAYLFDDENPVPYASVINGQVRYEDDDWKQRVESAQIRPLNPGESIYSRDNVKLVNNVFSAEQFAAIFPEADEEFTYHSLLTAIAHYPKFCNEFESVSENSNMQSQEKVCRRELATLFAHVIYESGQAELDNPASFTTGLKWSRHFVCHYLSDFVNSEDCKYFDEISQFFSFFPPTIDQFYYGRGATMLRWNTIYGRFSKAWFDMDFDGDKRLLNNPNDQIQSFSSALWHYMTPQSPKTSAHQLIAGFYKPDENQKGYGVGSNFGSTIDVMGQSKQPQSPNPECFQAFDETPQAQLRGQIYKFLLQFFGLQPENDVGCLNQSSGHSVDGLAFWNFDPKNPFACKLENFPTQFTVYNSDDYKRCVCFFWGDGESECQQKDEKKCYWSETPKQEFNYEVSVTSQTKISFEPDLVDTIKTHCFEDNTSNFKHDYSFLAIELYRDNEGKSATSPDFRSKYQNLDDSKLGSSNQLEEMYIAIDLGQDTIFFEGKDEIELLISRADHVGTWIFHVRPCVDRTKESIGAYDCSPYYNIIKLKVVDLCEGPNSTSYEECSQSSGPDPVGPDPDPIESSGQEDKSEESLSQTPVIESNEVDKYPLNTAPILLEFNAIFAISDVKQGETFVLDLGAQIFDPDTEDVIEITATIPDALKQWVTFNQEYAIIELKPTLQTKPGLKRGTNIELNDGKEQTKYVLSFWVDKAITDVGQDDDPRDDKDTDIENDEKEDSDDDESEKEQDKKDKEKGDGGSNNSNSNNNSTSTVDENTQDTSKNGTTQDENALINPFDFKQSDFDPATLWAMKLLNSRKQTRQEQIPPEFIDEREKIPPPKVMIKNFNQIGEVQLLFNQPMLLDDVFSGIQFQYPNAINDTSTSSTADVKRHLQENKTDQVMQLERLILVQVKRGDDETSAQRSSLGFKIYLTAFSSNSIDFKIEFDQPLSVSIGDKPDSLVVAFRASELFISEQSSESLMQDSQTEILIPKQFPSETSYNLAVATGSTVQVAANTAFLSQFGFTILLAVSLKAMWNLMHTMQLVAYLRLIVKWPANSAMMLQSMHNAITLENLINSVYDSVLANPFNEFVDDDNGESKMSQLQENGISYDNLMMSLGIFGIFLAALCIIMLFYFLLRLMAMRFSCCSRLQSKLRAKLFYSVWIRYMIESYLKMLHSCIFYLFIQVTFDTSMDTASSVVRIAILTLFVIWPFFVTGFLMCKRSQLDKADFKQKFISMYGGLKTQENWALMYTMVFCVRRMLVVVALLVLQGQGIWLILSYNALQSFYFWYIIIAMPHEEGAFHNRLEYFNELCLIMMQYMMIFFIGGVIEPEVQWQVGNVSMGLLAFLFFINIVALIYLTVRKIKLWLRVKKAKKLQIKALKARKSTLKTQETTRQLNDAKEMSAIVEELSENDLPQMIPLENLTQKESIMEDKNQNVKVEEISDEYFKVVHTTTLLQENHSYNQSFNRKIPTSRINFPKSMIREQSHLVTSSRNFDTQAGLGSIQETSVGGERQLSNRKTLLSTSPSNMNDILSRKFSRCETNADFIGGLGLGSARQSARDQQSKSRLSIHQQNWLGTLDSPRKNEYIVDEEEVKSIRIRPEVGELASLEEDSEVDQEAESPDKITMKAAQSVERALERHFGKFYTDQKPARNLNISQSISGGVVTSIFARNNFKVSPAPPIQEVPSLPPSGQPSRIPSARDLSIDRDDPFSIKRSRTQAYFAPEVRLSRAIVTQRSNPLQMFVQGGKTMLESNSPSKDQIFTPQCQNSRSDLEAADAFYVSPQHVTEREQVQKLIAEKYEHDLIRGIPLSQFLTPLELPTEQDSSDHSHFVVNLIENEEQAPRRDSNDTQRGGKIASRQNERESID